VFGYRQNVALAPSFCIVSPRDSTETGGPMAKGKLHLNLTDLRGAALNEKVELYFER
jgi:hypothetical protein